MNGVQLGSKQIVVRLHEPKQLRQEKLAQRFGLNGHPRSASGATSPTASEMGDFAGWQSPRGHPTALVASERQERGRRGSGSYYNVSPQRIRCIQPLNFLPRRLSLGPSTCQCDMMTWQLYRLSLEEKC